MRRRWLLALISLALLVPLPDPAAERSLTFEQRVRAQEAIERVYYSHLTGATRPFEQTVPRELLERKVRTYLQQSVALEEVWRTPITGEALRHEMDRIARGSRFPDRLQEIYSALENDSFVIEETFARASLADRLSRSFFASDQRLHGSARAEAALLRSRLVHGDIDVASEDPRRAVSTFVQTTTSGSSLQAAAPGGETVSPAEFTRLRSLAPASVGEIGPLSEERDAILFRVLLDEGPGSATVATYAVAKQRWEEWWPAASGGFDVSRFQPEASGERLPVVSSPLPSQAIQRAVNSTCVADDTWDNGTLDDLPDIRSGHSAVWTGSVMIVWGGTGPLGRLASGSRYDPLTDSWSPTSMVDAPEARANHSAVWTGSRMIVWGGFGAYFGTNTGGLYDPVADVWTPTSTNGAPQERGSHSTVWTGSEMIVWGGFEDPGFPRLFATGGRYDAASDTWRATSTANAPTGRQEHTAIWTGIEMIVWGGRDVLGSAATGGRYDPVSDTWLPTSVPASLPARRLHSAVWTGADMIIWGGMAPIPFVGEFVSRDGFRYSPASDLWTPLSLTGGPMARIRHSATWTGTEMIVWGGTQPSNLIGIPPSTIGNGSRYNPSTETWSAMAGVNELQASYGHTAVWTGSIMITWGGVGYPGSSLNSGGRYDPGSDSWTPTLDSYGGPPGQVTYAPAWTGNEMLLWSLGSLPVNVYPYGVGARYNLITDSWTPITTLNSPRPRLQHAAVWTGSEMIVWGGGVPQSPGLANDGGKYDPLTDTWSATSTTGAPTGRINSKAVWTGQEMIVWGGSDSTGDVNTGGRYDPASDTWRPMSATGTPTPARTPTAIWTGSDMIVWGGRLSSSFFGIPGEGGRYNPQTDTWTATSTLNVPPERMNHSAIWTGDRMIVYGGARSPLDPQSDVGQYDPATDTWTRFFTNDSLLLRAEHSAVWTGSKMIIWGGFGKNQVGPTSRGGVYDPAAGTWTSTSMVGVPTPRYRHAAVWTGSFMLIWGGNSVGSNRGGRYALGQSSDDDLDGSSECAGDCDDTNPATFPGAQQICADQLNNDCLDPAWPSLTGTNESDDDGDSFDECQGDCDDATAAIHPGASEVCNGLDDDCDGSVPPGEADGDGDGYRGCQNDCNDADPTVMPAATELPGNAADENCDGTLACGPAAFYKTHGVFVRCVVQECGRLVDQGHVSRTQCDALISGAAQSNVGRRQRLRHPPTPSAP